MFRNLQQLVEIYGREHIEVSDVLYRQSEKVHKLIIFYSHSLKLIAPLMNECMYNTFSRLTSLSSTNVFALLPSMSCYGKANAYKFIQCACTQVYNHIIQLQLTSSVHMRVPYHLLL